MGKDWTGNSKAVFSTLAASNHSVTERIEKDYYATDPRAVEELLKRETFSHYIIEPAVGGGHIANVLKQYGHSITAIDIKDRGYQNTIVRDFLTIEKEEIGNPGDIITNPPYSQAAEFVKHALDISDTDTKVAMFLKIQFWESKKRYELFQEYPPKNIYVFVSRINCGKNGEFTKEASAVCYAWFVWEKGFKGKPTVDWIE